MQMLIWEIGSLRFDSVSACSQKRFGQSLEHRWVAGLPAGVGSLRASLNTPGLDIEEALSGALKILQMVSLREEIMGQYVSLSSPTCLCLSHIKEALTQRRIKSGGF